MNKLIEDKGVNALRYYSVKAFRVPGHKWPGNGDRWLEQPVIWCSDSVIRRSVPQISAPQPSVAQCFSAGIQNAPEPTHAEGVYALATPGRRNIKGRKRPPVQRSVVIPNPNVNVRATEPIGVNARAMETDILNAWAAEMNQEQMGYWH